MYSRPKLLNGTNNSGKQSFGSCEIEEFYHRLDAIDINKIVLSDVVRRDRFFDPPIPMDNVEIQEMILL